MNNEKVFINQALQMFGVSRTTLYSYLKKLNIKPKKSGNRSYLTNTQTQQIRDFLEKNRTAEQPTPNTDEQPNNSEKFYKELIEELKTELKDERQKTSDLTLQLGQWQGRAKTLEEQNTKLIEDKNTIEISEKTGIFAKISQWWKK